MIVYVDYPCRQKTQLCHRNRLDSVPARNTLLIRNFLTPSTRAVTTKPAPPKGRGAITRAERPPSTKAAPEEEARVTAMIRYRRCSAPAETGRLPEIEP